MPKPKGGRLLQTENPMPRQEVAAKCRDLLTPVLGAATSAKLIEKVLALESVKKGGHFVAARTTALLSFASRSGT